MGLILTDAFTILVYIFLALLLLGACIHQCYYYSRRF